ncbi:hypothetical protein IB262_23110 [Ensifer sp. ENS02]|uniref:phospholipase D-like domain-containing protein n=1 Tax=Ensifer sp. ENS02 TaxID=2769290 RepID=UPI00177D9664|nr:phospholipase D-like domain-containing protein [Ensifer sp. ENS02]MBD9522789.1 hypothetical protein [Ensifer sp. ENS02]
MRTVSLASEGKARFIVTMPPTPSRIGNVLASTPAAQVFAPTETADAFRHLARKAQSRLVIMTPYIDAVGCAWVLDLFDNTPARERILILQSADQLSKPGVDEAALRKAATRVLVYGDSETDETFHSKIVLADGSDAYVGSANFLNRSKGANLECGLLVEGPVVASITTLVEAVLQTFEAVGA